MFKTKTVFVVGAGGSYELGLPVGDTLKGIIAKKVNFGFENNVDLSSGNGTIWNAIYLHCAERGETDLNLYLHCGRKMAVALPQALSIDHYLHTHASSEMSILIGKMAIVQSILEAEKNSKIYINPHSDHGFNVAGIGAHWHNTFCQILTELCQPDNLQDIFSNVSFITFNYDRCIERYISLWLASYFHLEAADAEKITKNLTVIHPYGKVGALPWESQTAAVNSGDKLCQIAA